MSNVTTEYNFETEDYSVDLELEFSYTPGEPEVRYYPDMSGYPGSPPEVELLSVVVTGRPSYESGEIPLKDDIEQKIIGDFNIQYNNGGGLYDELYEQVCDYVDSWEPDYEVD